MAVPPRGPLIRMLVRPVAIRRNVGFDVFNVRLLVGLDKLLRAKRRYQGDLSASINDALLAVNLNTVKLVALQGKKGLIVGIANESSIAWGCARAFRALGAEVAVAARRTR